jgi:Bacteriophage tail sheath protein
MPETVAPGVDVEDASAGAHAIAGVPTSTVAFLGATEAGPVAAPLIVHSFAEFEAQFGVWPWRCRSATPCSSISLTAAATR